MTYFKLEIFKFQYDNTLRIPDEIIKRLKLAFKFQYDNTLREFEDGATGLRKYLNSNMIIL